MGTTAELRLDGMVIWSDASVFAPMEPRLFEPGWLRVEGRLRGSSQGRDEAYFLRYADRDMVLRHFRRGGLIGRFNRDLYLLARVANSRAMREFTLLDWMREQGLPVPRPLAARHLPTGPFYRADLITERIPDARPLAEVLLEHTLPERLWSAVGAAIRQMHDLEVNHADLNCRNILIDAGERAWLIDFDKCERRAPGGWKQRNLARLKRSFEEETDIHPGFNWTAQDWSSILSGYLEEIGPQVKRS